MNDDLIKSSFEYCENIARSHYENFPVASKIIPQNKRKYIYTIYAFARQADDYADEPGFGNANERLQLIDEWNRKLEDCFNSKTDEPIFLALSETVKDCRIHIKPLENLLKAFRQDVLKNRYESFTEVLSYCENSANPVGHLVLMVFGCEDDALFSYSDKICTALQLTNFWQDIKIDLSKNRIYLPNEDMSEFEYSEKELFEHIYNENFIKLMRFEVEKTDKLFVEGEKLLGLINDHAVLRSLSGEIKLIINGGRLILKKIKAINYDVFNKRPVITGMDKIKLFAASRF
ncbi:MAG: squalene synthase HpnC [Ignavibacteria bacterium]|jgi:squalene synthase HpnC